MGGAGLPFGLMVIALLAIVVLVAIFVVVPWARRRERERKRITDSRPEALVVYEVPEGQDPATIVTALRNAGLEATEVLRHGRQRVVIACPEGRGDLRPRARALIANEADLSFEGDPAQNRDITFVDE